MNITGGSNLSLFEVQEAADIVALASDEEVNMIFGSVINENLNDEIIVTVIATGFSDEILSGARPQAPARPAIGARQQAAATQHQPAQPIGQQPRVQEPVQQEMPRQTHQSQEDALDIPTFLRNRRR